MSRSFLFGGQPSSHQSKYLVEFRAGKMSVRDNMVTPSRKKGLVYLNQTDDNLMHFCWKDRTSGAVEDDLIIFPDDAEFKKVAQCTTGRVYVLRFKSSSRRCFYWMQEPSEDKDDELCNKVNEYLNNPPAPGSRSGSGSSALASVNNLAELGGMQEHDLQNLFSSVTPQQLMQMLTNANSMSSPGMLSGLLNQTSGRSSGSASSNSATGGSSTTASSASTGASTNTTSSANAGTTTSTATSSASNASGAAGATASSAAAPTSGTTSGATQSSKNSPGISLSALENIISRQQAERANDVYKKFPVLDAALNSDALRTLLANPTFMRRVKEFLPESSSDSNSSPESVEQEFKSTFKSPQFRAALQTFHAAFQLGSLGPLMSQFNLSARCIDAAQRGDLEAFVKGIEESEKESKPTEDNNDKDSDMALD